VAEIRVTVAPLRSNAAGIIAKKIKAILSAIQTYPSQAISPAVVARLFVQN